MIGYLKGKLMAKDGGRIVILGNGIGWSVNIFPSHNLIEGEEVEVYTEMIVRENDISLWGFLDKESIDLFRLLLSVSGVGPKTGVFLIGTKGCEAIYNAIIMNQPSELKVSGIGPKTAQKIILELKTKIDQIKLKGIKFITPEVQEELNFNGPTEEAIEGLVVLGYKREDVIVAMSKIKDLEKKDNPSEIIKEVLKIM